CAPWGGSTGRLAALGATLDVHHGPLGDRRMGLRIQFNVPLRSADARAIMEGPAGTRRSERYRSGRNGGASKASCRVTGTWVRIPPSPPVFRPLSSFFVRFRRWSFVDRNDDESDFLSAFSRFPIAGGP